MPHIAGLRGLVSPDGIKEGARDPSRAVYRYHVAFAGPGRQFLRKSFLCAARLSPWSEGMIRRHELVSDAARAAALGKIKATGRHTDAVLAGIRDTAGEVERIFRKAETAPPTLKVTTKDGVHHTIWRVNDAEVIGKLRNYLTPKKLHVLDGHDTYEAMLAYQAELAAKQEPTMYSAANYGLFCIVPLEEQGLVAAARHKIIKGTTAKRDEVLAAAKKYFIIDKLPGAAGDVAKLSAGLGESLAHQPAFVVVFKGDSDGWKLTLSPDISPIHEGVAVDRAMAKLDPVVVEHLFVQRMLPGATVTTELDAQKALGAGGDVTVLMRPMTIDQIAHVDELNQTLPPASTAIYPPLAQGLISYVVDPDEDLV
jgi:hypothetical protein